HLNADVEPQRLTVPNGHIDKKVESPKKTDNIKGNLQCSKLCEDKVVQPMNGTYNCKRCRKACLPHELVERAGSFYHRNCVRCAVCNQLVRYPKTFQTKRISIPPLAELLPV
ncbi:hypothetical protein T265_13877, partial [Opisthorchis viverrini]